jgi:hypothetical protein
VREIGMAWDDFKGCSKFGVKKCNAEKTDGRPSDSHRFELERN